jgi:hypothetical protein
MIFYTCGVCDREFGLRNMHGIDEAQQRIQMSGIPLMFAEMIAPINDPSASVAARAYAAAAIKELDGGIRRGCGHICTECCKQLPPSNAAPDTASSVVPKLALVNGYFRGECPKALQNLSLVDQSLISLINVVTPLSMLSYNSHYQSSATVFSVLNDVVDIATKLPRNTQPAQLATIIKPDGIRSPKALRYNPRRVLTALRWLKAHNELYANVPVEVTTAAEWLDGGVDDDLEVAHISSTEDDYEGIAEADLETPAGDDGHPVNPGAPNSSTTDVLMHNTHTQDALQQLASIARPHHAPCVMLVRTDGEYVADYATHAFLQKAFPLLYPYGRGGPGTLLSLEFDHSYISNMLLLGGSRPFQQSPRFIFYSYTWLMRKRVGTISLLGGRNDRGGLGDFTAGEARQLLADIGQAGDPHAGSGITKTRMWSLISKLQPFAQQVPGTELYFAQERKKLMAMISSPVTTSTGQWTWFFTEAQADKYLAEIYDNAVTSFPPTRAATRHATLLERQAYCNALTEGQRQDILRAHPFMSARIHALQQEAYWANVLSGQGKPLGEVSDYWMRVEFQMKGTPHWHTMINVTQASLPDINEGSVKSEDIAERRRVEELVSRVATARLQERTAGDATELPEDGTTAHRKVQEKEWAYNINRPTYFADSTAPGRERFQVKDYSVNSATGVFSDSTLQILYRRLQLANQMHVCRKSCYKYCKPHQPKICRYGFTKDPVEGNEQQAVIVADRDRRGRTRTRVLPPRNNGNINNHLRNPLCFVAGKGNQDIQYIQNTTGGAEYCSKYCSKAEAVESTALQNAVNRKLAKYASDLQDHEHLPLLMQLRAVGHAVVGAQQVGTVQACYVLGKLPLVKSSRATEFVNCLKRTQINTRPVIIAEEQLSALADNDSALSDSPTTQHGKRDAYHALWKQQMQAHGVVHINFFALLSSYTLEAVTSRNPATKVKEGSKLLMVDSNGFIVKPVTFKLGKVRAVPVLS